MRDRIVDVVLIGCLETAPLVGGQLADLSGRTTSPQRMRGNSGAFEHHGPRRHQGPLTHETATEDKGANADQGSIPHDRAMDDRAVTNRHPVSNHAGESPMLDVQDGSILNVGVGTDLNPLLVAAQHTAEPDRTAGPQTNPSVQTDSRRDPGGRIDEHLGMNRPPIPMLIGKGD